MNFSTMNDDKLKTLHKLAVKRCDTLRGELLSSDNEERSLRKELARREIAL